MVKQLPKLRITTAYITKKGHDSLYEMVGVLPQLQSSHPAEARTVTPYNSNARAITMHLWGCFFCCWGFGKIESRSPLEAGNRLGVLKTIRLSYHF